MGREREIVLRRSRRQALMMTGVCLAFAALGVWLITRGGVGLVLLGAICAAMGFVAAPVWAIDIVRPRVLLRVCREGFEQRVARPYAFIAWSDVTDVSAIRAEHSEHVAVTVRDPDRVLPKGKRSRQIQASRWFSPSVKLVLGTIALLAEGFPSSLFSISSSLSSIHGGVSDIGDVAKLDLKPHGTFTMPAGRGWPWTADELVALLDQWHSVSADSSRMPLPNSSPDRPVTEPERASTSVTDVHPT
jgi:hypothetical protein